MRRALTLGAIWILLFGVTVGVRTLLAASTTTSVPGSPIDIFVSAVTKAGLKLKPLKTPSLLTLQGPDAADSELLSHVAEFLRNNDAGIQRCRRLVMPRSVRPTEYFELSFVPRISSSTKVPETPREMIILDDVVLERSTLTLTPDEERCIVDEFRHIHFDGGAAPNLRMPYELCFKSLKPSK